jgi:hypothetical protein
MREAAVKKKQEKKKMFVFSCFFLIFINIIIGFHIKSGARVTF